MLHSWAWRRRMIKCIWKHCGEYIEAQEAQEQGGFRSCRGCVDQTFVLKQLVEKQRERKKKKKKKKNKKNSIRSNKSVFLSLTSFLFAHTNTRTNGRSHQQKRREGGGQKEIQMQEIKASRKIIENKRKPEREGEREPESNFKFFKSFKVYFFFY